MSPKKGKDFVALVDIPPQKNAREEQKGCFSNCLQIVLTVRVWKNIFPHLNISGPTKKNDFFPAISSGGTSSLIRLAAMLEDGLTTTFYVGWWMDVHRCVFFFFPWLEWLGWSMEHRLLWQSLDFTGKIGGFHVMISLEDIDLAPLVLQLLCTCKCLGLPGGRSFQRWCWK